ncbi:MAG: TonB-dependent receptor, partial [Flavisolibacter sp.]
MPFVFCLLGCLPIYTHARQLPAPGKSTSIQNYSVYGTITSEKTGETIIGASVTLLPGSKGTSSNDYGFYSLSLNQGNYTLIVSAIGMVSTTVPVLLEKDIRIDIKLKEEDKALETVIIKSRGRNLRTSQMGVERISVAETKNIPVLLGERDVLKTLQLLPGVKSAGEGSSGFYVRGGAIDQNLILLDEAPVYNASHLLGFFSTFNSDAIKNVTLYKGGMPVQYGGRLSSVVDIRMNEGNNQDFGVNGGIGIVASRLNIEGPIQKNKSSFLFSARRTYADLFLKLFGDTSVRSARLYFYDL